MQIHSRQCKTSFSDVTCANVEVVFADGKRILFHEAVSSDFSKLLSADLCYIFHPPADIIYTAPVLICAKALTA